MAVVWLRRDMSNTAAKGQQNCVSDLTDEDEELLLLALDPDLSDCNHWQVDACDAEMFSEPPALSSSSPDSGFVGQCSATGSGPFSPAP